MYSSVDQLTPRLQNMFLMCPDMILNFAFFFFNTLGALLSYMLMCVLLSYTHMCVCTLNGETIYQISGEPLQDCWSSGFLPNKMF